MTTNTPTNAPSLTEKDVASDLEGVSVESTLADPVSLDFDNRLSLDFYCGSDR